MLSIGIKYVLLVWLFLPSSAMADALQAEDPIFGLRYDPSLVEFEEAPAELVSDCPELTTTRWTRRMWVYARVDVGSGEYMVIGGMFIPREGYGTESDVEIDSRGAVIHREANSCLLIGPAREVFDYGAEEITPSVLRSLARDSIQRLKHGFGTAEAMRNAMKEQRINLSDPHSYILREALASE